MTRGPSLGGGLRPQDLASTHSETAAQYCLGIYDRMIPNDVEFSEYNERKTILEITRQWRTPLSEGM